MKSSRFIPRIAPLAGCVLLPMAGVPQTTSFTATGWIDAVPVPGIRCTNAFKQICLHASAHTARVQGSDPRATGQILIIEDVACNTNGTANLQGSAYLQIGTWNGPRTNFTATGGLWRMNWQGLMQADNSLFISMTGYGSGADIDGWHLETTVTRAAATDVIDPTIAYLYTGRIKPPPLNTTEVLDDFTQPYTCPIFGSGTCISDNGQFTLTGDFRIPTRTFDDSFMFAGGRSGACTRTFSLEGTTREWRADLVSLDDNATNMAELVVSDVYSPGYSFFKARDFAFLLKWSKDYAYSILWCERTQAPLPNSNVALALALTRQDPNLVITARVLDHSGYVLFTRRVTDTPASDESLTPEQFEALTGMQIVGFGPDVAEAPPTQVGPLLGLFQYTDGYQPVPTAVYQNLLLKTSELPLIDIERAVRISWPASAFNYIVEAAPSVNGPWLPVQYPELTDRQQITVSANGLMGYFRVTQAP